MPPALLTDLPPPRMPPLMWPPLGCAALGFVIAIVIGGGRLDVTLALADIARLPRNAGNGPAIFTGTLARKGAPAVTPMGVAVAGWKGEVHSVKPSKRSALLATLCVRQELDGIALRIPRDGSLLPLRLSSAVVPDLDGDAVTRVARRGFEAQVARGPQTVSTSIPSGLGCALEASVENERRTYLEHRFPVGATAIFIGCKEKGALGPCRSHRLARGSLFVGDLDETIDGLVGGELSEIGFLLSFIFLFVFIAAIATALELRRYLALGA